MKKDIYILGISESVGASAALIKNGTVVGAYMEERFNRKKAFLGYPKHAIHKLLNDHHIRGRDIAFIVLNFNRALIIEKDAPYQSSVNLLYSTLLFLSYKSTLVNWFFKWLYRLYMKTGNRNLFARNARLIARDLKTTIDKVISFPHHLTHAASTVYTLGLTDRKLTVLTNDGVGDTYCTSVSRYENHTFSEIAKTPNENSLASLYAHITRYMGMKTHQDEYKVMGLAPYASENKKTYDLLNAIHTVTGLTFISTIDEHLYQYFLEKNLSQHRFDAIAHAIQRITEEKMSTWVTNAIQETGIADVAAAGGIFMNVKANKVISELKVVNNLFVMPSASDESTAIGAAYLGYVHFCKQHNLPINTKPLNNLYLGNKYSNTQIESFIKKHSLHNKYKITKHTDPEMKIAQLLAKGHVVARFAGRMEFGQRALGNRSLLADPSNRDVVRLLNDQIKSRDFWMPFACSILDEDELKYSINPKHLDASSMILSFDTKKEYRHEIQAAIHPYDYTLRPQIVTEKMNKRYYHLIREFKKLTGIGAVLNTSLNLHGEPIVCSLDDGLHTFNDSDLHYLMIEHWLIEKQEA